MGTFTIDHNIQEPIEVLGAPDTIFSLNGGLGTASASLMNLDTFKDEFPTIDGRNSAVVIIDTGINRNHSAFGNRIVYQYDFGDNDNDATDKNGHGTNVSSIIASSHSDYPGIAEGVDIIHLKVFTDSGSATSAKLEDALRWVIDHSANNPNAIGPTYNITAVNMSLGDYKNWSSYVQPLGLHDEFDVLANELGIVPVAAAGNFFYDYNSQPGVSYPAADRNTISVSAVFDRNVGSTNNWGAQSDISGPDFMSAFTQRHATLTTVVAPGVQILGASKTGNNTSVYTGTSQAAPQVTGVVVLAQELAQETLGRTLTFSEIEDLLQSSATNVRDGDNERDNVTNTNLNFKRVDMMALAEQILLMAPTPEPEPEPQSVEITISKNGTNQTYTVDEYGSGKDRANIGTYTANVQNQTQLDITGNTWLQVPLDYNVTLNTVVKFDFRSTQRGEIHGFGFDANNTNAYSPDANNSFRLYGTEWYGANSNTYKYTSVGNWQTFEIPVGQFLTGDFNHLFFINDQDVSDPTANSSFRDITIYENDPQFDPVDSFPNLTVTINGIQQTETIAEYGSNRGVTNIGSYTVDVQNGNQLDITGNTWLQLPVNTTVTPDTVLQFDFRSTQKGDIHAIGLDADNSYQYNPDAFNAFRLYGSEWFGPNSNTYKYTNSGNWQTFTINLGQYFSGNFDHIYFANDHDVTSPIAQSSFRNIQFFEQ